MRPVHFACLGIPQVDKGYICQIKPINHAQEYFAATCVLSDFTILLVGTDTIMDTLTFNESNLRSEIQFSYAKARTGSKGKENKITHEHPPHCGYKCLTQVLELQSEPRQALRRVSGYCRAPSDHPEVSDIKREELKGLPLPE